ncbi:VIT family protein [Microbacterium dextranolyticum]|uniref:Membrane protein n=1 Tax=Microbacterium dextranolyticum TaxID=36806 RepID=A0A9W6M4X7_9MICO|nr:membrane protein [Microbacterium dextranolyticum]
MLAASATRPYRGVVSTDPTPGHPDEPHRAGLAQRLNGLRAGVLGANDGIVSTAAVVVGVAGATAEVMPVLLAGSAALVGGAISMALGEYVSVSSQRDSERALIEKERQELASDPHGEFAELVELYRERGLSEDTATRVATELTAHDALSAHLSIELNIDQDDVVSPWSAAIASAVAFTVGALLPMATILLLPHPARLVWTFVAVLVALAVTGYVAAWIGGARRGRAIMRTVVGGALALGATFLVGTLFGAVAG